MGPLWAFRSRQDLTFPLHQVYSMARITTLVAVILNILRIDDSRSINCQVRVVSLIYTPIDDP
jgi:hypothetical protein